MFFLWFCRFHRFQVFSVLASILAEFSTIFNGFGSWNDCGASDLPPVGLAWVKWGTTFSLLGAILGLLCRWFLMPCLVLVTFLWFGVPQMPSKTDFSTFLTNILSKYHQILDAWAVRGLHRLVSPQHLLLQNSHLSISPGLQASKPPSLQAFNLPRRVTRSANNFI